MRSNRAWTATTSALVLVTAVVFTAAGRQADAAASTPIGQRLIGAYVDGSTVASMESDVGRKLDIVSTFENWSTPFSGTPAATGGRTALIAWEPAGISTQDVVDGRHDAYLRTWASAAKASGQQLFIRPWPEMNGEWAQWSAAYTGGDKSTASAEQLKSAWRHVHDVFTVAGASNVKWVFSVNETDEPAGAGNRLEDYYPGDSYVDVLGFDAYNWAGFNGIPSRTHRQILDPIYARLAAVNATKPIWLTEGSASPNVSEADKAAWFAALLAEPGYPRLAAYVLFSTNKEQDWRYNSSSPVVNAFRQGLALAPPTAIPPSPSPAPNPVPTTPPGSSPPTTLAVLENQSLTLAGGEGADVADVNASGGSTKYLWWTDRLTGAFPPGSTAATRLVVRARGILNGRTPTLVVDVDGNRLGTVVLSGSYRDYAFSGLWTAGKVHTVTLTYFEGRVDTDVYVDKMTLG
jgi:mannan endo-1,4-beta-mannosidase